MSPQTEHKEERVRRDWRIPDQLWEQIEPLLPPGKPHPLGCHNPRVSDRAALAELARRIDAGELRSVVGEVFPLEHGREAFEAKRRSGVPGKVVLQVAR